MGVPKISLLQENPLDHYECDMCGTVTRKNKFAWESRITNDKITICRECAYKERFGTKNMKKAKANRILEEKEINK